MSQPTSAAQGADYSAPVLGSILHPSNFLDAFQGSHSERILRHAPCPALTVPAGSLAAAALQGD